MSKLSLKTAKQERNEVDQCGLSSPWSVILTPVALSHRMEILWPEAAIKLRRSFSKLDGF